MSNSEPEPEAERKVKAEENSDSIVVVDPDDYQRTQKLKAIDEAKKEYKNYKRSRAEKMRELEEAWANPEEAYMGELGMRIAGYGDELMPLIKDALEKGAIEEEDLYLTIGGTGKEVDVREIIRNGGQVRVNGELEKLRILNCSEVYRKLEDIERKMGLGVELEVDKGPAEI